MSCILLSAYFGCCINYYICIEFIFPLRCHYLRQICVFIHPFIHSFVPSLSHGRSVASSKASSAQLRSRPSPFNLQYRPFSLRSFSGFLRSFLVFPSLLFFFEYISLIFNVLLTVIYPDNTNQQDALLSVNLFQ